MRYFSITMAIFYFVMGAVFVFTGLFTDIPTTTRYGFGAALFLYSIYRAYKVFRQ